MFNSTVLEVGIGLLFCFSAVSLIVSSINEGIASLLSLRGKNLLTGIGKILNAQNEQNANLLVELYKHAAINPHADGQATQVSDITHMPSYIEAASFAKAFTDVLKTMPNASDIKSGIDQLQDPQLKQLLSGMVDRANDSLEHFEGQLADWFNTGMDRLSGSYKRRTQQLTFVIGLAVAVLFNIDFLHLFHTLWAHPALAQTLTPQTLQNAATAADQIKLVTALPVGWEHPPSYYTASQLALMAVGWLITALSTLFGAPFWFDMLQKAVNLRSSGPQITGKESSK